MRAHLRGDATDWPQIAALYGTLAVMMPSPVVEVNRAVAVAMAQGPTVGLLLLHQIEGVEDYYPYHVARADLLRRTNEREAAADAYKRALALCGNSAERAYLQGASHFCGRESRLSISHKGREADAVERRTEEATVGRL